MSQYPYSYSRHQGQPATVPPGLQPPAFPTSSYNTPYQQSPTNVNHNISQASFDYNANNIPGLGITSPPAAPPTYNNSTDSSRWATAGTQSFLPPQAFAQSAFNGALQGTSAAVYSSSSSNNTAPPSQPVTLETLTSKDEAEEGELSEGQFEDLYEPREIPEPATTVNPIPKPYSAASLSRSNSAIDTPEAGFYANDDDDNGNAVRGNTNSADARERSGSYSPFLSPRELQTENLTSHMVAEKGIQPPSPSASASQPPQPNILSHTHGDRFQDKLITANAVVPGLHITPSHVSRASSNGHNRKTSLMSSQVPSNPSNALSIQEARKEAQMAILALLPMGVKYQTYIDEGFEKDVIKGLFQDLHLDMPKSPAKSSKDLPQQPKVKEDKLPPSNPAGSSQEQNSSGLSAKAKPDRAGEERKDRIARLLAAKAAKAPVASAPTQSVSQSLTGPTSQKQESSPPASSAKTKIWGQKELLIKQKMAALQKSREAQAQKSTPVTTHINVSSGPEPNSQHELTPRKSDVSQLGGPNSSSQIGAVPGLPRSRAQTGQIASQRKRPVAADFVDYSSSAGPLKRPFGQDRKESSLIIDISDGSDDEDIDMEMGSPVDDHTALRGGPFAQRGPAVRDFPPLSDGLPNRQFSSPVPLSHTQPGGSILTRRKETELDLKEREIQEMRRRIAEAEAKRKAKKPSAGSQTPQKASGTPELRDYDSTHLPLGRVAASSSNDPIAQLLSGASSVNLPKFSEQISFGQLPKREFRARIVSQELPRIKESIEEKTLRLKQLQEEQDRLRTELDQEYAEEKVLTEKLQEIDAEPSEIGSQPNGTSSSDDPGHVSASEGPAAESIATSSHETSLGSAGQEEADGDVSMDEDPPSRENSESRDDLMSDAVNVDTEKSSSDAASTASPSPAAEHDRSSVDATEELPPTPSPELDGTDNANARPVPSADHTPVLEAKGHPGAASNTVIVDETSSMELESPSLSPAPAEPAVGAASVNEESPGESQQRSSSPAQISDFTQPRETIQEIERGAVREVHDESSQQQDRSFVPYKSPLRYFHAYRYHPSYTKTIRGGLRSLTYSNRIDPNNPLCPYELGGQPCPPGCQFQHFASITPPEDQILVDLGRSDDFTGEQKNRFIQGLREVLQGFRANKVKDFDTIARGIIEYRSRFLGDPSRVLHLEGVTI